MSEKNSTLSKLKFALKDVATQEQRHDCVSQQALDMFPVLTLFKLGAVTSRISEIDTLHLKQRDAFSELSFQVDQECDFSSLSPLDQCLMAEAIANRLGCYDAADLFFNWSSSAR